MIQAEHISMRYGAEPVLTDVSFSLSSGQWLMVCGPNGAGKSTLVRAITGVLPGEGRVRLLGRDVRRLRPAELARQVGVLAQHTHAEYDFTVEQVAALGRYAHRGSFLRPGDECGEEAVARALASVGLTDMRERRLSQLSGGERQRVFLAQVFAQEPNILMLDEPANHLDLTYQKQIFDLIDRWRREPGRAVMAVVHDLDLARSYGTHALLLAQGHTVARGTVADALTGEHLAAAYGMDVLGWKRAMARQWEA